MINLNEDKFDILPTENELLKMIPSYEIFKYYIHADLHLSKPILSPLRVGDNRPSFSLYQYDKDPEIVLFTDFGSGDKGNAVQFVSKLFNISIMDAIRKIIKDISIDGNPGFISETETRNPITITVKSREWEQHDVKYWNEYGISTDFLTVVNCKPVAYYFINKNVFKASKYAYGFREYKDYRITWKIYQPFNKEFKFISNHTSSTHQGYTILPQTGEKLIITKSYKDVYCLLQAFVINAVGVQGEYVVMKPKVVEEYKSRFKRIYTLFDNDDAGKRLADIYFKLFKIKPLFIPDKFYPIKDISDYYKTFGKKDINFDKL